MFCLSEWKSSSSFVMIKEKLSSAPCIPILKSRKGKLRPKNFSNASSTLTSTSPSHIKPLSHNHCTRTWRHWTMRACATVAVYFATSSNAWANGMFGRDIVSFLPMILIFGVFYFFLIRPQQQKQRTKTQQLMAMKTNNGDNYNIQHAHQQRATPPSEPFHNNQPEALARRR